MGEAKRRAAAVFESGEMPPNARTVFAVVPQGQGDGIPLLLVAVPEAAWEYMHDGKTHHFDLTSIGVPIKLMLFGCRDEAEGVETLKECAASQGSMTMDMRNVDFAIKPRGRAN